jgi:predicted phage-related endonuclease
MLVRHEESGTVAIVEAKTAAHVDGWGAPGTDEAPAHIAAQALWQLAARPDAARVFVARLGPFLQFDTFPIERDDEMITALVARCLDFWESLSVDVPPPLDTTPATLAAVRRTHPDIDPGRVVTVTRALARRWLKAKTAVERAESRERGRRAELLALMGDGESAQTRDGVEVARRQPAGRGGVALVRKRKEIP